MQIERSSRFKKDFKAAVKRGKKPEKLRVVIEMLLEKKPLPAKYCDHCLSGKFSYARECHIEPDWLLIYTKKGGVLRLERTGSHADLF